MPGGQGVALESSPPEQLIEGTQGSLFILTEVK